MSERQSNADWLDSYEAEELRQQPAPVQPMSDAAFMQATEAARTAQALAEYDAQQHALREQEAWEEPQPLPNKLAPVEPFNEQLLPEPLRAWVMDIAERADC
ncbi:MAG: hypothetical protein J6T92_03655, partial [Ottowia sp.]|nr:hypothetical protein [Ottowia sp.]